MNSMLTRFVCRILAASVLVLPFPAQAGLIGTERAASAPMATDAVSRAQLAAQLQTLGISPEAAAERVGSLTDGETAALAGRVDQSPAGGVAGLLWIAVAVFLVWRLGFSDQAKAESAAQEKAAKPAPEKK